MQGTWQEHPGGWGGSAPVLRTTRSSFCQQQSVHSCRAPAPGMCPSLQPGHPGQRGMMDGSKNIRDHQSGSHEGEGAPTGTALALCRELSCTGIHDSIPVTGPRSRPSLEQEWPWLVLWTARLKGASQYWVIWSLLTPNHCLRHWQLYLSLALSHHGELPGSF